MRIFKAFLVFAALLSSAAAEPDGAAIVEQAKTVTGGAAWDRIIVWHEKGAFGDLKYEHWEDLRNLRCRNVRNGAGGMVFDGRASWTFRGNGTDFTRLDASAAPALGAYMTGFGFFFPERFPARMVFETQRVEDGVAYDVVTITPRDLPSFDLWLDARTHRVARLVANGGQDVTTLSDYRIVDGVLVPFASGVAGGTVHTARITFEPEQPALFAAP